MVPTPLLESLEWRRRVCGNSMGVYHEAMDLPVFQEDTIVAPATPPGEGGVSIVRVSGPKALALADHLFHPLGGPSPSRTPPRTFRYGQVVAGPEGPMLDDAILLVFHSPHSYTGEDCIEIQCHGSPQTVRAILDAAIAAGARMAEPGEFTKRSFLNGKMDLTQAEAVADLIHARSERAARFAANQLQDALGGRIRDLYDGLLQLSADVEALLDFPDYELPQEVISESFSRLDVLSARLDLLLATKHEGCILREGLQVVIAGAPNTGKSTLMNRLSGSSKSIISHYPGTTRDIIESEIVLHGYPIRLLDTAGLRPASNPVEQEGVHRARQAVKTADLCICIVDASQPLSPDETEFLLALSPETTLCLANKTDLGNLSSTFCAGAHVFHPVSLLDLSSPEPVIRLILRKVGLEPGDNKPYRYHSTTQSDPESGCIAVSERHWKALSVAREEMQKAADQLAEGTEEAYLPAAIHLRTAAGKLAAILGRQWDEDTLDAIFSRFCVGK